MSGERRKEITYHLPVEKIDELLREATDDRRKERLGFLKNLYYGIRLRKLPTRSSDYDKNCKRFPRKSLIQERTKHSLEVSCSKELFDESAELVRALDDKR
jgi:hypothetical protein